MGLSLAASHNKVLSVSHPITGIYLESGEFPIPKVNFPSLEFLKCT